MVWLKNVDWGEEGGKTLSKENMSGALGMVGRVGSSLSAMINEEERSADIPLEHA